MSILSDQNKNTKKETEKKGYVVSENGKAEREILKIPEEIKLSIVIDGRELVTLMCTPHRLNYLVAGFLYLEGIIDHISELCLLGICDEETRAQVRLKNPFNFEEFYKQSTISSGCGGGIVAGKKRLKSVPPLPGKPISTKNIFNLMKQLYSVSKKHRSTGGIHSAGLSLDGEKLYLVSEDIGRHNTIDKLGGECFLKEIFTRGGIIVTTGRISSEMVAKASRMQINILASRTAITTLAYQLAQELGITLIGYIRARKLRIYTHPENVLGEK